LYAANAAETSALATTVGNSDWKVTPLRINMEQNHGGLVQIIFLSKWVMAVGFDPFIFQGATGLWQGLTTEAPWRLFEISMSLDGTVTD